MILFVNYKQTFMNIFIIIHILQYSILYMVVLSCIKTIGVDNFQYKQFIMHYFNKH